MKEIEIKVKNMMCQGCENRIKNSLETLKGIKNVKADHNSGIVKLSVEDDVIFEEIYAKLDDIGFEVIY